MKKRMKKNSIEAQELIKLYKNKENHRVLEKKFELRRGSIPRMMNRWGVDRNIIDITPEQREFIVKEYKRGISSEKIAKNMGICPSSATRALEKENIKRRPPTENKLKCARDARYFENIDTSEKAYFLGLLYADGHISSSGGEVSIVQKQNHIDILEKFSMTIFNFVKLNKCKDYSPDKDSPYKNTDSVYYKCNIYSTEMNADLTKWGCTARKSHTITFPNFLNNDLYSHFIRGFVDGDGCISIPESGISYPRVNITSNLGFLEGFVSYIVSKLNIKPITIRNKKNNITLTRSVEIKNRKDLIKFLDFIYKDATVYLDCKKNNYDKIIALFFSKAAKQQDKIDNIEYYSTTYIPQHNGHYINKQYIKSLSYEEKNKLIEELFDFYRDQGFPYYYASDDNLFKDFVALKKANLDKIIKDKTIYLYNKSGSNLAKQFSKHQIDIRSSRDCYKLTQLEAFNDDIRLKIIIAHMLDKENVINGNALRNYLGNRKFAYRTSTFLPTVAKLIYEKYCKENDIVYDFSCGFGQRLTAAMSLPFKVKYIGIDPSIKSIDANKEIFNFFQKNVPGFNQEAEIIQIGAENFCPEELIGKVNFAFSSPPYYDLELYDYNNNKQACHNRSYVQFINEWWKSVIINISKLLTEDGIFALNVGEKVYDFNFAEDMSEIVKANGFEIIDLYKLEMANGADYEKHEPIFIFKKKVG